MGGRPPWPRLSEAVSVMHKNDRSHGSRQQSLTVQGLKAALHLRGDALGRPENEVEQGQIPHSELSIKHEYLRSIVHCVVKMITCSVSVLSDHNSRGVFLPQESGV